jgi:hypothetical protein
MDLRERWLSLVRGMNERGIPLPMARDEGKASESLTLVIISSTLVIVGIIGKWGGKLNIDVDQALQFFYACAALHWGRGLTGTKGNKIDGAPKTE